MNSKLFNRQEKDLKEVRAIVVHYDGSSQPVSIDGLWNWMNKESGNSYHYLVCKDTVYECIKYPMRAIHCGHKHYTKEAIEMFGERCEQGLDSPNNYTIGICALYDYEDKTYSKETIKTTQRLLRKLKREYNVPIIRHSDICGKYYKLCPFEFAADDEEWEYFLRGI